MKNNQIIWKGPADDWIQNNDKKHFFILSQETGEIQKNQSGLEIIADAKWHVDGDTACGGFFPSDFDYCPYCKAQLYFIKSPNDIWMPPYGGGSGLRLSQQKIDVASIPFKTEKAGKWIDQEKDVFSLPRPRGDYEFIVGPLGTKNPVLISFDRMSGSIDYFSPGKNKWIFLTPPNSQRVSESRLPNWSWSTAFLVGKAGFAIPTNDAPVWIALDWMNGTFKPIFGKGECIGGAANLQNQIFILVKENGSIAIQYFDFTSLNWKTVGEPLKNNLTIKEENNYYSVPIVDERRCIIYWVGITGRLVFDLINQTLSWTPWETDAHPCRAVPEFGPPYYDPSGLFWQLCYDDYDNSQDERAFRYYKLNGDESDRMDVDGGRFSSGISCWAKTYDLWDTPWTKKGQDLSKSIRSPLLCIDEESKATITAKFASNSILPILEIVNDRTKKYYTELRIEFPHDLPIQLRMPNAFNIPTPWELRLFIYQQYLFVYSATESVCYKWRLK